MTEQDKFKALLLPVYKRLNAFAVSLTRNRNDAKELIAETLAAAWSGFGKLKNDDAFLSYLFTIASRLHKKRYRRKVIIEDNFDFDNMLCEHTSAEEKTDINILFGAIEKLTSKQKEALILFEITGLSQSEIAIIQNTTVMNIKLRIHRAKKKLKEILT